jgi:hypothetical protein
MIMCALATIGATASMVLRAVVVENILFRRPAEVVMF